MDRGRGRFQWEDGGKKGKYIVDTVARGLSRTQAPRLRDPFNMQHYNAIIRYGNVDQKILNRWDTRNFGFTFTYCFVKGKSSQSQKHGGLQDEQGRVGAQQQLICYW